MKSVTAALLATAVMAAPVSAKPMAVKQARPGGDIPRSFTPVAAAYDYEKREVMIPMRDGVRLHTVIVIPRGATRAPMMLDRTPYSADALTARGGGGPRRDEILPRAYAELTDAGYILVAQDVRGKYGSEGDYIMNRPIAGPLNPTRVDHATDAYDTIDWLVKHVPESNGRVGTIGTSYDGFTALMSLVNPHPALKASVPMNPMVDVWKGDDWFHNGAFRQEMMGYMYSQTATKASGENWHSATYDDYDEFLRAGSPGALAQIKGLDTLPFWQRLTAHPAYDAFWQGQAVDRILARSAPTVPTLFVDSLWDQEDIYGAVAAYQAVRAKDPDGSKTFLVMGPWHHGQENGEASALGALKFDGDTGEWFRRTVMIPFLDSYLKDGAPPAGIAHVTAYQTGTNAWKRYDHWPLACNTGCATGTTPLWFGPQGTLSFSRPAVAGSDAYVSDPAKPVTYRARPMRAIYANGSTWRQWLVDDQRFAAARPDVLTYTSAPLTAPVAIAGQPIAHLFAATTGSDADWVVKLIDVYPDNVAEQPELGGYQLAVSMDVLRARYRDDPANPTPVPANRTIGYTIALPTANHVFKPGHRIMVQVQSSWFPLYDRNPQTYVPNIFFAKPVDYVKATQTVTFGGTGGSAIELPVVAAK